MAIFPPCPACGSECDGYGAYTVATVTMDQVYYGTGGPLIDKETFELPAPKPDKPPSCPSVHLPSQEDFMRSIGVWAGGKKRRRRA
jgi:hypothetical protein